MDAAIELLAALGFNRRVIESVVDGIWVVAGSPEDTVVNVFEIARRRLRLAGNAARSS